MSDQESASCLSTPSCLRLDARSVTADVGDLKNCYNCARHMGMSCPLYRKAESPLRRKATLVVVCRINLICQSTILYMHETSSLLLYPNPRKTLAYSYNNKHFFSESEHASYLPPFSCSSSANASNNTSAIGLLLSTSMTYAYCSYSIPLSFSPKILPSPPRPASSR